MTTLRDNLYDFANDVITANQKEKSLADWKDALDALLDEYEEKINKAKEIEYANR